MARIYHLATVKGKPINHILIAYISAISAFLMMFQIYMVAPILNNIVISFGQENPSMDLLIPAFTISIGISSLFSRKLTVHFGDLKIIKFTLLALALSAFSACLAFNSLSLIATRMLSGIALGNLLPLSFSLTARNFSMKDRHFPIMLIIFGMAGGMTFGPVFGTWAISSLGWRWEFALVGIFSSMIFFTVNHYLCSVLSWLKEPAVGQANSHKKIGMIGRMCIILFILLNGVFHSGLFVWTNTTLALRYHLSDISKGIWLLDFGLPGLVLIVLLGVFSKEPSLIKMELIGLAILAFCIFVILLDGPMWLTLLATAFLSVGYNITQPLFFGLVGRLGNNIHSQIFIQLGCCFLFIGYGLGPLVFGILMRFGNLSTILFFLLLVASLATIARSIFENDD